MKIITCYKCVPDEQDIAINNADGTLDFSKADSKISQYDLNAIEAACQLKQQLGDAQVVAMSVGGKALTNAKGRKDVLSRGPDELIVVIDDQFEQALPQHTATALAAAAQKSGFDLLICGDGSSDLYAQQVGLLVGEALNIPAINGVSKILSLTDSTLTVERELEDEVETLSIPLPAVIAVSTDINPTNPFDESHSWRGEKTGSGLVACGYRAEQRIRVFHTTGCRTEAAQASACGD